MVGRDRYGCRKHRYYEDTEEWCSNALVISRSMLEQQLIDAIVKKLMQPEMLEFAITEFDQQRQGDLARKLKEYEKAQSGVPEMERRNRKLKRELENLKKAIRECDDEPKLWKELMGDLKHVQQEKIALESFLEKELATNDARYLFGAGAGDRSTAGK